MNVNPVAAALATEARALRSCSTCRWQRPASDTDPYMRCARVADRRAGGGALAYPLVEDALASPRLCGGGTAWVAARPAD